jgi:hypothetical protein
VKNPYLSTTYKRLALAHIVHLRTVAEGIDPLESACRHLGVTAPAAWLGKLASGALGSSA